MKERPSVGEGTRALIWTTLGCLVIAAFMLLLLPIVVHARPADDRVLTEPTVKVAVGAGHGSGVHTGGGYVVTAAHVVNGAREPIWVTSAVGKKRSASVVFLDTRHDLAILKLSIAIDLDTAALACRSAVKGEEIEVRGNPAIMDFISAWGRISGSERAVDDHWLVVLPMNVMIVGGNSGGPVFDAKGKVLAIAVGVGLFNGTPFVGLAVPATVVCAAAKFLHIPVQS